MIKYIKGDAVEALKNGDVDYLIHCCNAQGVMGSGIAKQIKKEFPESYQKYHDFCNSTPDVKERMGMVVDNEDGVLNLIGQESYGPSNGRRYVHYGYLQRGLISAWFICQFTPMGSHRPKVAIPYKMACDRAGGNWEVVEEMIEVMFDEGDVYIYHLEDLE